MHLSPARLAAAALCAATLAPTLAAACGGVFCNSGPGQPPVAQAGENIVFAPDGDQMHMIVRLTWSGPPTEFGWLMPVPPDVEAAVAPEGLFVQLDQALTPFFVLRAVFQEGCGDDGFGGMGGSPGAGGQPGAGGSAGVDVLARAPVGPYDMVVLRGDDFGAIEGWLRTNDFQVPNGAAAVMQPYLEMRQAFMALKLLPGTSGGDVVPVHLTFTSPTPAIPLRPTGLAADRDMPIRVHLLGPARAVPINYLHVQIDQARVDWSTGGDNYDDVVAVAVDDAGGQAFATDFAGTFRPVAPRRLESATLEAVAAARTVGELRAVADGDAVWYLINGPDTLRVLRAALDPNAEIGADDVLARLTCPWNGCGIPPSVDAVGLDGAALVERLEGEIFGPWERIDALFDAHPFVTRLTTRMDMDEMTVDPVFDFNPDLDRVSAQRQAFRFFRCAPGGGWDPVRGHIEFNDGRFMGAVRSRNQAIRRRDGRVVQGAGLRGAWIVEQHYAAGQPDIVADY
ncbi:MAG: DUF2330 domain-containing protein, partial [Myxococcales bacterium]|nr:DUF2330 domain-containing protein [Myxococcales bacterium]